MVVVVLRPRLSMYRLLVDGLAREGLELMVCEEARDHHSCALGSDGPAQSPLISGGFVLITGQLDT